MDSKEKSIKLTLLGGVNEVGGNIIFLEDHGYDVRLFLDFGIKIDKYKSHYQYGESPSSIEELLRLGVIPKEKDISIHNLYIDIFNPNLRKQTKTSRIPDSSQEKKDANSSNLDGILISHPHKDHYLGISFVNRNIPIYAGFMTKKIIRAFSKSAKYTLDNNFEGLNWRIFRTGDILDIKGLKIVPCHIDHSIPAAYGFIIYSSAGPIVYTGDFRMHGPLSNMTEEFLQEIITHKQYRSLENINLEKKELLSKGIKVLICEGTKVHKGVVESEKEVENNLEKIFENNPFNFILVKYDRLDWDRFRTFSNIAKKYGWKYIISEKDAYFYYLLNKDKIYKTMSDPNILEDDHIYILKKGNVKFKWQEKVRQALYIYQKSYRIIEYSDLSSLEGKYFVYLTDLRDDLIDYLNLKLRGLFISSSIDPFAEEFFDNNKTIRKELEKYGIPSYRIHASGHVMPHDLINFIEKVKPEYLIPIHTENAQFFEKLFKNTDIQVIINEVGEAVKIDFES